MTAYSHDSSEQLYDLLPEHYRDRDTAAEPGQQRHLKSYLDAFGNVLDLVRHTLEQRLRDSFPDTSEDDSRCQEWLIPYFAELFATRLRSPFPDGQRREVASAVRWAQRKGTLQASEEIVEAVTLAECELREGFQITATTARIGMPPTPVTPDLRRASRAILTTDDNPDAQFTRFGWNGRVWPADDPAPPAPEARRAKRKAWIQANPNAAPCFPGSYEDLSRRTVDFRNRGPSKGQSHPKRLSIHLPPAWGFFTPEPVPLAWSAVLTSVDAETGQVTGNVADYLERRVEGSVVHWRNITGDSVEIRGDVTISGPEAVHFEKLRFEKPVTLNGSAATFTRCAIGTLSTSATEADNLPLDLTDCLVATLNAPKRTVLAQYVTVLKVATAHRLLASDCVFAGSLNTPVLAPRTCVRFSRVPAPWLALQPPASRDRTVVADPVHVLSSVFGQEGCGVLDVRTSRSITEGAEDGGEMGCGHAWRYSANLRALMLKLAEYLPLDVEPAIVHDPRLLCSPPQPI